MKKCMALISMLLLSASCNLLGGSTAAGIVKTVNGGADWQFTNRLSDNRGTLNGLNVSKMAFDPSNRETVYAGGYNGGLYKSTDSGVTWNIILSKILVYNFVINPTDTKTMYVSGIYGNFGKVLKTTDGGGAWQEVYNESGQNNPVRAIALDPGNQNQLLIGTEGGSLLLSSDAGLNWRLVKDFGDRINSITWYPGGLYILLRTQGLVQAPALNGAFATLTSALSTRASVFSSGTGAVQGGSGSVGTFYQVYIDPVTPQLLYLTTDRGLFKSVDGGKTWIAIQLPLGKEVSSPNVRAVAVARNSSNVVYTNVGATVYKSVDGGQSFQTQSIATGGFINYILIDPVLPQIVYAGVYGN